MSQMPETSMSLLKALAGGKDQDAWALFVELYWPALIGFAERRGLTTADAEEV